jgi:hypothetical protein
VDWIVKTLNGGTKRDEVLLIPFSPQDREGNLRDLHLCQEISSILGGAEILSTDGFSPRRIKYAISRSRLVLSGGRYHALVWAAAHVPFTTGEDAMKKFPKLLHFIHMFKKYGSEIKEMEKLNTEAALTWLRSRT